MITEQPIAAPEVAAAYDQYNGLLNQLEEMTGELVAAIESWDTDKVGQLMEARSRLCDQVCRSIGRLSTLMPERGHDSPVRARLEAAIQRVREREQVVLEQQAAAEKALSLELQRRRPELVKLNECRSRQGSYRNTANSGGRFLDSKI